MSLMLGTMMDGLFGGAQSAMSLYKQYDDMQALQRQNEYRTTALAEADKNKSANDRLLPTALDNGGALDQPSSGSGSGSGGDTTGPAVGPVYDPAKLSGGGGASPASPGASPIKSPTTSRSSAGHDPNTLPTETDLPKPPASAPAPAPAPALGSGIPTYATPPQTPVAPGAAPVSTAPSNMQTYDTPQGGYVADAPQAPAVGPPGGQPVWRGLPQASPNTNPTQADVDAQKLPAAALPGRVGPTAPSSMATSDPQPSGSPPATPAAPAAPSTFQGRPSYFQEQAKDSRFTNQPVGASLHGPAQEPPAPAKPDAYRNQPPAAEPGSPEFRGRFAVPPPSTEPRPSANPYPVRPPNVRDTVGAKIMGALGALNPISSAHAETSEQASASDARDSAEAGNTTEVKNAAQPAQVAAQQSSQTPAPAAGPTAVSVPASSAPVAPGQTTPTVQSEATPKIIKPLIDPRYYNALNAPYKAEIDRIAAQEHVTPQRLAAHWYAESGMKLTSADGAEGERGVMQMLPGTHSDSDPHGQYDANRWQDSLTVAARHINRLDRDLGQDSVASVVGYQSGPGNIADVAAHPDQHPNATAYVTKIFGQNAQIDASTLPTSNGPKPTMQGVMEAARSGPDGVVRYVAQTSGGLQMTDGWRRLETMMMADAGSKGDAAGMAHARDFVLQMSHQGMTENLTRADELIRAGNPTAAIPYLAKAHAFVPDGQMAQFGQDAKGNIWGHMVDEHDPSRTVSKPFQVTSESLQSLMTQTAPQYVKSVQAQIKAASEARLNDAHAQHYKDEPAARVAAAAEAEKGREFVTRTTAEARRYAADQARAGSADVATINAAAKVETQHQQKLDLAKAINTESEEIYGDSGSYAPSREKGTPGLPLQKRAAMSQVHYDVRMGDEHGMSRTQAQYISEGVVNRTMSVQRMTDGRYGVLKPGTTSPIGFLSATVGQQYAKPDAPNQTQAIPQSNAPSTNTVN